jgi:hypothetical protein
MRALKKLKQSLQTKPKEYYRYLDKATKIRFNSEQTADHIKHGYGGLIKGLVANKRFQSLSEESKKRAFQIVDEECNWKPEYKPKDLVTVGKRIEKRLRKEFKE